MSNENASKKSKPTKLTNDQMKRLMGGQKKKKKKKKVDCKVTEEGMICVVK